ncbi:hypothetical protein NQ318_020123 [Aromia moschata]|uniref:Mos1 transposase HTH domain-containing protein n=1 Tax=Aromia moschata TaxID=1265417 RepID=A0AAV8ZCG4_9CUCU|nr:hypothetical protein NQ318_020123 [Aromia moschata]
MKSAVPSITSAIFCLTVNFLLSLKQTKHAASVPGFLDVCEHLQDNTEYEKWFLFYSYFVPMKQRVNLKFLVKLGKTFTEAMKKVYVNKYLSRTQVFKWLKGFKEGRETTEDDPRPGQPSTSGTDKNIEKIGNLIHEDRNSDGPSCVRRRRPDLWKTKSWKIHPDNAPTHSAL